MKVGREYDGRWYGNDGERFRLDDVAADIVVHGIGDPDWRSGTLAFPTGYHIQPKGLTNRGPGKAICPGGPQRGRVPTST